MKIILVHHGHGEDVLQGKSEEKVIDQLAKYCRQWWSDVHKNKPKPENRDELITQYFAAREDEWWEFR